MPNAGASQSPRNGRIVTFYSFKGGTGRTMALANVAWILAANGMRVLIADWDLESPGLHRFFQPFLDPGVGEKPGIVDFIRRYEWAAMDAGIDPYTLESGSEESRRAARDAVTHLIDEHIDGVKDYAIPLSWQFPDQGVLHFLSSGKQANGDYQMTLSALDWDNFYDNLHGGQLFDALREFMKRNYDYVLIDSRTGLSDVADICTVHLPDMVIDCFTLATQGIEGAAIIARMIQARTDRDITILPVPMRIDHAQKEKVDAGLALAASQFEGLPAGISEEQRGEYWAEVEVPYRPSYTYEETLATIGDRPGAQTGLLPSYERIAARITEGAVSTLPPREEWLRLRTRLLFSRTQSSSPLEVVLDFSPEDQLWAEWIAAVLASAEIMVRWVGEVSAGPDDSEVSMQTVAIVSESYITRIHDSAPVVHPDLLIAATDTRLPPELAEVPVIFLAGLSEAQAVDRLVDRLKGRRPAEPESGIGALRYPGRGRPQILNIPARRRTEEIERAWKIMLAGTPDPEVPESLLMVTGKPEPEMAESLRRQLFRLQFNLANILRDLAQFQEARAIDEAVLEGQRDHLGAEHLYTLQTQGSLAADMRALGEYKKAMELDLGTYRTWSSEFGEEYRGTLAAAHNLGLSYLLTGNFRRALAQDRQTLDRMESVLGLTHPRTLNSGSSVARDLLEAGRYTEAVTRMETVWGQCREALGDSDRTTLNARLLLGVAQRCAGHPELAESHIEAARTGLTRGFGQDSSDALACRLSQALNWLAMERFLDARTAAEEVRAVYRDRVGSTHPHSLICGLNIATAFCLEEDYRTAQTEARSAVEGLQDRLGADHPYTLAAKMVLANVLASQRHLDEAVELEELVRDKRERILGPQHPDTLRCRANLLLTQHELGIEGTSAKRQAVIEDLGALIGSAHPDVTTTLAGNRLLCAIDPLPF